MKKQFILAIGGQNNTGFVNTEVLRNDFGFDFDFNRVDVGVIKCPQFNKNTMSLKVSGTDDNLEVYPFWDEDNSNVNFAFWQRELNQRRDDFFDFGGLLIITEEIPQETDYTPFELSKLAHAQSILFGSGSKKLISLAEKIGAPRP